MAKTGRRHVRSAGHRHLHFQKRAEGPERNRLVNIAITGATGFVGRNLMNALLTENHRLSVLCHRVDPLQSWGERVKVVQGRVEDSPALNELLNGVDLVFHLVGLIAETRSQSFDETVVQGTRNLVTEASRCGVKRIIYLSALGTSENARTKYHHSKLLAERAISESGIAYTILRSSVIIGKGDGFLAMLENLIRYSPLTPIIGNGRYKLQPIAMSDLISSLMATINCEESVNRVINLAGPEQLEYLEMLSILKKVMRKRRLNIFVPIAVMKMIAGLLESILKPAPITRDQLVMMEMGNTGDIVPMKKIIGVMPITFEETLVKIYSKNGDLDG